MPRYFIELGYHGRAYAGFQVQPNANTVQGEVEKALGIFFRKNFSLTGSSRTDTGVHARQNYFHFDWEEEIRGEMKAICYHLNAILPADIFVRSLRKMPENAHCRFDASSRHYRYRLYFEKDPFLADRSYFFPFSIDKGLMQEAAGILLRTEEFASFCKRNSQALNYRCTLYKSEWSFGEQEAVYDVAGNRFLRGMVRGLVGTMLRVGRGQLSINAFTQLIAEGNAMKADFSVPGQGLTLLAVDFPSEYFLKG